MIRYLELRNWRAFDKATLHLKPGATFIVAENGIGKTSLLRGAAWTLFADSVKDIDPSLELRSVTGANETVGVVTLETVEGELHVERRYRSSGRPKHLVTASLDGISIDPDDLSATLSRLVGVRSDIAAQLGFVHQHALQTDRSLFDGVETYLKRMTGVEQLETTRSRLLKAQKSLASQGAKLNAANRETSANLEAYVAERAELAPQIEVAKAELGELEASLAETGRSLILIDEWDLHDQAVSGYLAAVGLLDHEISQAFEGAGLDTQLDDMRTRELLLVDSLGQNEATVSLHGDLSKQLESADATCPVCMQTIAGEQAITAASHHRHIIEESTSLIADERNELAKLRQTVKDLQSLQQRRNNLVSPVAPAGERPANQDELRGSHLAIEQKISEAKEYLVELGVSARTIDTSIEGARSELAQNAEAYRVRRLEGIATATIQVLDKSVAHHVANQIEPLTEAITQNWGQFFSGDGRMVLNDKGALELVRDGHRLAYSQLSGGQQMLGILALRLTLVSATTKLGCVWLDEPLEHLDPINRRRAANLLVDASRAEPTKQIVVTTYEEETARRLAATRDGVHLEYVRSD